MPKQIEFDGKVHEFPDDFTDADIQAALSEQPAEAAPAPEPQGFEPGTGTATKFVTGALRGGGRSLVSLVNPLDWARAAKAAAALGYRAVSAANPAHPSPAEGAALASDIFGGAKDVVSQALTDPEAAGELVGSTGVALVGPKMLGRAGSTVADLARRSRASNIVRAVSGPKDLVPVVAAAGDSAELPISLTQGQLARRLAQRAEAAGAEVGATKAALPGTVKSTDVARRLPSVGVTTAEGDIVTGARPLRRNIERTRTYYESMGEPAQPASVEVSPIVDEFGTPIVRSIPAKPARPAEIPRSSTAVLKEEAQGEAARGGAYAKGHLGQPVAPGAEASAEEATAIRAAVLDRTGLSPADAAKVDAYEKALGKSSLATALSEPAQMEHLKRVSGAGAGGDWKASLIGRVVAPGIVGGTIGALGGVATSPLGALAGMGVAEFMKSTIWRTLSAATKLKAARALESGGVEAFREVVIPAAIADVQRRRLAERALQNQGEGVIAP